MAHKAQHAGRGSRLGRWAARRAVGVRARAGAQARADAQAAGAQGRAERRRAGGSGAGARRRWGARSAGGRAAGCTVLAGHGRQAARARSLCAQAGPVGCSCTRLGFQPGFSTRYFS